MSQPPPENLHSSTVLAVWLRPLADYLERYGYDSRELFAQRDIDVNSVFSPNVRLPLERAAKLWQMAAELTKQPFIGLEVYRHAPSLQADTLAVAMMASRNLYEALQRMARLIHVICNGVDINIERKDTEIIFNFVVHPEDKDILPAESMDPAFLIVLNLIQQGLVTPNCIKQLGFERKHPGKEQALHLKELLGIDTLFNCDNYYLVIDWDKAQITNPYWNPALAQASEDLALRDLQQINDENVVARVRRLLVECLAKGTPQQDQIAISLNITTRQLQRRLASQGTTFGELLQQVRLDLAHQYLRDPHMTMVDISLSLGFQDQSNFVKAFKKWCGETPGQYRKQILG